MPPHAQTALWLLALLQTPVARADERPLPGAISREIMDSQVIVIGQFTNAQGDQTKGTTDLVVQEILKGDAVVAGKKTITVERYVADKEKKVYLAFGTVKQGMIEFHLGIASSPAFIDYVRGLLRIDVKDRTAVVKYCFDRLEDKDSEIAARAVNEFLVQKSWGGLFSTAPDPRLRTVARKLSPQKLRQWLGSEDVEGNRADLYCCLLGICGDTSDVDLLQKFVAKQRQKMGRHAQEAFIGIVRLSPKDGFQYARNFLKAKDDPFGVRYSAYSAIVHFLDDEKGVVAQDLLLGALSDLIEDAEFADFPIFQFWERRVWKYTDRILALKNNKAIFRIPVVRRQLLLYALQCPDPAAQRFIAELRKTDPDSVSEAEELLKAAAAAK
jgi:hypothetical protein